MTYFIASVLLLCSFFTAAQAGLYLNVKNLAPAHKHAQEAEKKYGIPDNLLTAIAHVESKCSPYAVNARGKGHYFKSQDQAVKFVQELRAQGVHNINVGYMQLNVPSHIKRFSGVHDMLELKKNIDFAAALLVKLHKIHGSWPRAVERYKSNFCSASKQYQNHVYSIQARLKLPKIKEVNVTPLNTKQHKITSHTGSLHHTLKHITSVLPEPLQTGLKLKSEKNKTLTLKTIQQTTFTHLSRCVDHPSLAWKKTYSFNATHTKNKSVARSKKSIFSKIASSFSKAYDRLFTI